jgi:hypothetical protein
LARDPNTAAMVAERPNGGSPDLVPIGRKDIKMSEVPVDSQRLKQALQQLGCFGDNLGLKLDNGDLAVARKWLQATRSYQEAAIRVTHYRARHIQPDLVY